MAWTASYNHCKRSAAKNSPARIRSIRGPSRPSRNQSPRVDSAAKLVSGKRTSRPARTARLITRVRKISRSAKVRIRGEGFALRPRHHAPIASHASGASGNSSSPHPSASHIGPLR
ncbi:hypothetical protein [Nannocystis sp.]|uniref:hypothetical protein n=1 Tax=Nannocystis sp. TaxID=1962667 RepID=UPI0025D821FE|nr:hypothetical protein [Nannocystis sp.]MBK7826577.1 hypothetical protein [Nannocystis sp.]